MANSGSKEAPIIIFDSFLLINPSIIEKAAEVNERLQRLLNEMKDPSSISYATDLNELQKLLAVIGDKVDVPEHFRCPISSEIMGDPVILTSGVTYDRPYIQSWLGDGHKTCPHTQQLLSHSFLIPNYLVFKMILQWCKGIEAAAHVDEMMSSGPMYEQKILIKELQRLIKQAPTLKRLNKEVIHQLLSLLDAYDCHRPDVQEGVVAIILNLSLHDNKFREMVGEHPSVIPFLVDALWEGSLDSRKHAAAAVSALSTIESNTLKLGECGGTMEALVRILEDEAMPNNDALHALQNIWKIDLNRSRAANNGVLLVMLKAIGNGRLVNAMMHLIAMLVPSPEALHELGRLGVIPCLLGVVRDIYYQQHAAFILRSICEKDQTWLRDIKEEEEANGTFSKLSRHFHPLTQKDANIILEMLKSA